MEYTFNKARKMVMDGIYECVLSRIEPKTYNDRTYWQLSFIIRNDVDSNDKRYRNWYINKNINYGEYYDEKSEQVLNDIINTQEYEGKSIEFKSENDLLAYLKGILCKVKVKTYPDKNGETRQQLSFYKSDYKPNKETQIEVEIDNIDDLPF